MTINEFAAEVHKNAVEHGWWEGERTFPEIVALIHSEVSEALEEYRDGKPLLYFPCNAGGVCCEEDGSAHCGSRPYDPENPNARCSAQSKKPEGIAAELADVIIRVLDYCAYAGIDIEDVYKRQLIRNARIAAHILTAAKSANAAQRKSKRRIRRNTLAGLRNRTLKAAGNARLIIRTKLSNVAKIALLQKKPIAREGKRQ